MPNQVLVYLLGPRCVVAPTKLFFGGELPIPLSMFLSSSIWKAFSWSVLEALLDAEDSSNPQALILFKEIDVKAQHSITDNYITTEMEE